MSDITITKIDRSKLIVTQANRLAEASYVMSVEEKRIVLLMVSRVRKNDRDFHTYRIPVADIRDYLGLRTNKLYDDIKRVADSLMGRVLHIPEENGGWLKVGWIASARYVPKGSRGAQAASLDLCFSPEMKPYLLELKSHFTNFTLQNVASLRSFYSIRLYEMLASRRNLGVATFDVATLRHILKATDKYANYKDFRARVILTAQKELAAKTDLSFDFTETRRGRKVVSVAFRIRVAAKPAQTEAPPLSPSVAHAVAQGRHNGVRESVMRDLLAGRDPAHVLENIDLARQRHAQAPNVAVNLAGLTVAAITRDYAAEARAEREQAAARIEAARQVKADQQRQEEAAQAERIARTLAVKAKLAALSDGELEQLRAAFTTELAAGRYGQMLAASFTTQGWNAPGISMTFRLFASERL